MAPATTNRFLRCFAFLCVWIIIIFAITIIILYTETRTIASSYPAYPSDEDRSYNGLHIFGLPNAPFWATMIHGADTLIFDAAIVSLVAAVAGWLLAFVKVPVETEFVSFVLGVASLGTSMGALTHSMDMHTKYGKSNDPEYSVEFQDDKKWTVEGWTCTVKDLLEYDDQAGDYTRMCNNSRTIRFLTVPLSVFGLLMVVSMYLLHADRNKEVMASSETVEMAATDAPPPTYNENLPPVYTKNAEPEPV